MSERDIQKQVVMEFICRREDQGGLGYRQCPANIVSNDLFIPSVLGEFVKRADEKVWYRLMKKFDGEKELTEALKEAIKSRLLDSTNVAIFLNNNKTITFEGETVPLFFAPGSELRGDEDFEKNIFCAVEESGHRLESQGEKLYGFRPDVSFYMNGIYLGYMELKTVSEGQSAVDHGRNKVAGDYLNTVKALVEREKTAPDAAQDRKSALAIYEKAIHLVACDCNETYVLRNVAQFYDQMHQEFKADVPRTIDELMADIFKVFKKYPQSSPILTSEERLQETMTALYSKAMITKEILYYNFIENQYEQRGGQIVRANHHGRLIAPRPKQKFGCDKIMSRIREMLDHEKEPEYYNDQLRQELLGLHIPQEKIEEIILERQRFCNNRYVYSLLMQYAAGFGKSNIIGWTALQLKDFRYDGQYAYDKIMLVVDRLQLRGQLESTMRNMNIDKTMYIEAVDKRTFIEALDSNRRIIVVNIQKFLDMQEAISESGTRLKQMRVAFLIDEIHRSNSGEQHGQMINLFERLQDSFNVGDQDVVKKNLLIGFTATPDEATLTRFGEFISASVIPTWVPFDSYTMQEAIDDGFILDPTKHIMPYVVPIGLALPEGAEKEESEQDVHFVKKSVYEYEPRMVKHAEFIVDRLVSLVYGKIGGRGKAMLAVSSIPIAIKYTHIIRKLMAEKCEKKAYARYADAPIAIVYSDSQGQELCSVMNGGVMEAKVIENFKRAKNGLIIVVDKLQTGFDEPKLHTLFLDKEIKGINAIQTISRVNRTCKYKSECHVIDMSYRSVNMKNIAEAFKEFCKMTYSNFNPQQEAKDVAHSYVTLTKSEVFTKWYSRYMHERNNEHFTLELEDGLRQWIQQCYAKEAAINKYNKENNFKPSDELYKEPINEARDLRFTIGEYTSKLFSLKDVYVVDSKYFDEKFLSFLGVYCNIFRDATRTEDGIVRREFEVIDGEGVPGITLFEDEEEEESKQKRNGSRGSGDSTTAKGRTLDEILKLLQKLNEAEALTAEMAQIWVREIGLMFEYLKKDTELVSMIKDDQFAEEDKFNKYKILQNKYILAELRRRNDFPNKDRFIDLVNDSTEMLYRWFVDNIVSAKTSNPDFDYDTTVHPETGQPQPAIDMEHLAALIRAKRKPAYDEDALRDILCDRYEDIFDYESLGCRNIDDTLDNFFMVLNAHTTTKQDDAADEIKKSLNILMRAEELESDDRADRLEKLTIRYEAFLKKLYYMTSGRQEVKAKEEGKNATLSNAIYAVKSVHNLKFSSEPAKLKMNGYLDRVVSVRNSIAHTSLTMSEQEMNRFLDRLMLVYLYTVSSNITKLEIEGYDADVPLKLDMLMHDFDLAQTALAYMKQMPEITILKLARICIEQADGKYTDMRTNDWYGIVRDFVKMKTNKYEIRDDEPIHYALAAEKETLSEYSAHSSEESRAVTEQRDMEFTTSTPQVYEGRYMKTLATMQPWASLIVSGIKDVELRSQMRAKPGKIFIAASGSKWRWEDLPHFAREQYRKYEAKGVLPPYDKLPQKCIVGYVDIVNVTFEDGGSPWERGHHGIRYVLRNAHELDEPLYGKNKATPYFYNVESYDEDHLPPAHICDLN